MIYKKVKITLFGKSRDFVYDDDMDDDDFFCANIDTISMMYYQVKDVDNAEEDKIYTRSMENHIWDWMKKCHNFIFIAKKQWKQAITQ